MRVLVIGAGGFLGRALVTALANSDWASPIAATRKSAKWPAGITAVKLDARDQQAVTAAMTQADAVVNCVSGSARTIRLAAAAVFAAAAKRRVVHLSSMAVYGAIIGRVDENTPLRPDLGTYSEAKVAAELIAATMHDCVVLRPGCIYGGGSPQWTERFVRLLSQRRLGDLGAVGDAPANLVHLQDVVAAIMAALRLRGPGVRTFNLAQRDGPDWNTYLVGLARALKAVPVRRIPTWELTLETKVLAPLLVVAQRVLRRSISLHAITPSLHRLWQQDIQLDPTRAEVALELCWTPFVDGLAEAIDAHTGRQALSTPTSAPSMLKLQPQDCPLISDLSNLSEQLDRQPLIHAVVETGRTISGSRQGDG
jgi:nucleoside-diphosphate-sugar epimerase